LIKLLLSASAQVARFQKRPESVTKITELLIWPRKT
jgi:hypothetical protein